ncbi:MAG: A/G-specific adenine glycosylase [Actinobacteria bacterium]|nr:A/G-specific adenine glycosylase [Actinomycetota bacterium]
MVLEAASLLSWFETAGRDLPWRRTRDPWAVLVSELMLQQTQVARVVDRWGGFLERFPEPAACATAGAGAVVGEWAGLGYNRRAVALHRCACVVVEHHAGRVPGSLDALLALPGVGPYTARAVLAFAFERDVGVVDTNAARVLARQAGRSLAAREVQAIADASVPAGRGWAWASALLDLGATVCTARVPGCPVCPARSTCAWAAAGCPAPDPAAGSAGVAGRQAPFAGSDRQGRGRLVDALRSGPVAAAEVATIMGWPGDGQRAARVAAAVVADGLARRTADGALVLP